MNNLSRMFGSQGMGMGGAPPGAVCTDEETLHGRC